jgi:hypothetical protein
MVEQKEKYTLKEAAVRMRRSYSTIKRMRQRREIGVEELGPRSNFIYEAEIQAYQKLHQKDFRVII